MAQELLEQPSVRRLIRVLADAGGVLAPGLAGEGAGLGKSAQAKWIGRMAEAGLVRATKASVELTRDGWDAVGDLPALPGLAVELSGSADALSVGQAIALWPAAAQRAFVTLLLSAIAARYHLARIRPEGHPSFIAAGYTGSGKTSPARFACRAFGLDPAEHVVLLPAQTEGGIGGRRRQLAGGSWALDPSPLFELPFVCFDEFDKAPPAVRAEALLYFHAVEAVDPDTRSRHAVRPVPMLTANTPSGHGMEGFPDEYRRRAIVLHTDPLRGVLGDVDQAVRRIEQASLNALALGRMRPAATELPDPLYDLARDLSRRCLTDRGWELCDPRSIELLALGRTVGASRDTDLLPFLLGTVLDYLTCAETAGETRADWLQVINAAAGGRAEDVPGVLAAVSHVAAEQRQLEAARSEARMERAVEGDALVFERGKFDAELALALEEIRRVPKAERAEAAGLRRQLKHLCTGNGNREDLTELRTRAKPCLAQQRALLQRMEAAKQQLEQQKSEEQRAARTLKEQERVVRLNRQAERTRLTTLRGQLAALLIYDTPAALRASLAQAGLLSREWMPAPKPSPGAGVVDRTLSLIRPGREVFRDRAGREVRDPVAFLHRTYADVDRQVVEFGGRPQPRSPRQRRAPTRRAR